MLMLTGAASTSQAQQPDVQPVTLQLAEASMTIDPARGAKILSLKYNGQELLSQSRWPESFGSTFWTSPQKEWNWPPVPEFDKQPYRVQQHTESRLVASSPVSERLGLSVTKDFSVAATLGAFVVTYSIRNEGSQPRSVAPWEITRVANAEGTIFFSPADSIWPAGLMRFETDGGAAWYQSDEMPQNRKVNADGRGWLAYYTNGLLLVKAFPDLRPAQVAPGEAEVQVYVNRGKTYIELESQGAYTLLQPGQSLNWTVRWYLRAADEGLSRSDLMRRVESIIGKRPSTASDATNSPSPSGNTPEAPATYQFAERDTGPLSLDIFRPDAGAPTTFNGMKKPTILYVFGGGFVSGSRSDQRIRRWFRRLTADGYAVVAIDYRLGMKGFRMSKSLRGVVKMLNRYVLSQQMGVEDVCSAVSFLAAHPELGVDVGNMVIAGSSAGAIISLACANAIANGAAEGLPHGFRFKGVMSFAGGIISKKGAPKFASLPCPLLLFHGTTDKVVAYTHFGTKRRGIWGSNYIALRLQKSGFDYSIYRFDGRQHEVAAFMEPMWGIEKTFLEQNVMQGVPCHTDTLVQTPRRAQDVSNSKTDNAQ